MRVPGPKFELSAPGVYIPAWLLIVPSDELRPKVKMVYGSLFQWARNGLKSDRGTKQMGLELGMTPRTVERAMRKLKKVGLIGATNEASGYSDIELYNHPWMDVSLTGQGLNCPEYTETDVSPREKGGLHS